MATIFETNPARPDVVMSAAVLALFAGGLTLVASIPVVGALGAPDFSRALSVVVWLVVLGQVAGAVLLVVGGVRLAVGAGRVSLAVGAVLQLAVCVAYGFYIVFDIARDTTEPPATVVMFTVVAVVFAILPATSLGLAFTRSATEFLVFSAPPPTR